MKLKLTHANLNRPCLVNLPADGFWWAYESEADKCTHVVVPMGNKQNESLVYPVKESLATIDDMTNEENE